MYKKRKHNPSIGKNTKQKFMIIEGIPYYELPCRRIYILSDSRLINELFEEHGKYYFPGVGKCNKHFFEAIINFGRYDKRRIYINGILLQDKKDYIEFIHPLELYENILVDVDVPSNEKIRNWKKYLIAPNIPLSKTREKKQNIIFDLVICDWLYKTIINEKSIYFVVSNDISKIKYSENVISICSLYKIMVRYHESSKSKYSRYKYYISDDYFLSMRSSMDSHKYRYVIFMGSISFSKDPKSLKVFENTTRDFFLIIDKEYRDISFIHNISFFAERFLDDLLMELRINEKIWNIFIYENENTQKCIEIDIVPNKQWMIWIVDLLIHGKSVTKKMERIQRVPKKYSNIIKHSNVQDIIEINDENYTFDELTNVKNLFSKIKGR